MAPAPRKMVAGFNHNVQYQGRVYHVQTEDSGVENPHVITHLFVGGNILASQKTGYGAFLGSPDLERRVREVMERQHKEMLRRLVSGAFDARRPAAARSFQPGELHAPGPATAGPAAATGGETLFAEDLTSEKSLDEVIADYLARHP